MARLLLWSARMKVVWALLPLFASSGCLFLDSMNHVPSVSTQSNDITTTTKGGTLTVHAIGTDLEDGSNLAYQFNIGAADGQSLDPLCDYDASAVGSQLTITFYRTGIFAITVVASDSQHATATTQVMVTITDAKPAFATSAMVAQSSSRDACKLNAAGDTVTLALSTPSGDLAVSDPDAGSHASHDGCRPSETLTYTWRISDYPGGTQPALTAFDGANCAPRSAASGTTVQVPTPTTQVCLWTDPHLVGAVGMYTVVLDVSDGTNVITSPAGNVAVGPDEPPCITGTEPVVGSYVIDRTRPQTFYVDGVFDDRDQFGNGITYVWSVYRALDQTWREVPSWSLSTYTLDPSSFGVGEKLRVRVEALDRTLARVPPSTCALDVTDCVVMSCLMNNMICDKWKTWDLELR